MLEQNFWWLYAPNPGGNQAVYSATWSTDKDQDDVMVFSSKAASATTSQSELVTISFLPASTRFIFTISRTTASSLLMLLRDPSPKQFTIPILLIMWYAGAAGSMVLTAWMRWCADKKPWLLLELLGQKCLTTVADYLYNYTTNLMHDGTSSRGIVRSCPALGSDDWVPVYSLCRQSKSFHRIMS